MSALNTNTTLGRILITIFPEHICFRPFLFVYSPEVCLSCDSLVMQGEIEDMQELRLGDFAHGNIKVVGSLRV
jgi:hypothetical protein